MRLLASLALCLVLVPLARSSERAGLFSKAWQNWAIAAPRAAAQDSTAYGATSSGLCGLVHTGAPTCGRGTTLAASAGYGATFMQGRHDRGMGSLGVAFVPLSWLALSLELAGRIDAHPPDVQGKSVTGTGEPTLRGRFGGPIGRAGLSLGGEVGLWLPGAEAPSFDLSALSPDFKLLLGLKRGHLQLLSHLGARIDQSYKSAPPDLSLVRPGDRVTLGLSDSHALLVGLGLGYTPIAPLTAFAELSADILLGKQAPAFLESPLRAAAGVRYFVRSALSLELGVQVSLSQRPSIEPSAPLVPIEPRVALVLGLRATFGMPKPPPAPRPEPLPPPPPPVSPPLGSLSGVITDQAGAPLPEVTVKLLARDGLLETITDAEGRFSFEQLHAGKAEVRADAAGFKSAHFEVEVAQNATQLPPRALEPGESTGILRCLVRSFDSAALRASVSVRDERGKRIGSGTTDKGGSVEFALPSGQYRVIIEAEGYRSQRTLVQVAANEVAILNVDMRKVE